MLYLCSFLLRNLLVYAIGYHVLLRFCSRYARSASLLASHFHFPLVSLFRSKFFCSTNVCMACSNLLNEFVFFPQSIFWDFFTDEDNKCGRSGADNVARVGMNLIRWCMLPMIDPNCFSVIRISNWIIACFSFF